MSIPLLGSEFVIKVAGIPVYYATDFTFSVDKKEIPINTLGSGLWSTFKMERKNWGIEFNGMVARTTGDTSVGYDYFMRSIITSDASMVGCVQADVSSNFYVTGAGFLKGVKLQGGTDGLATFSGSFLGTSPLTEASTA